jgi:peptidoglycan/xylan/chitin deacetylase (PgdA/CDA1 family)
MAAEPVILMYHSVEDYTEDPYRVTVRPERFERQLRWLRRRGLRGVSMRELRAAPDPRGLVGLTFDDGYADFADRVLPALRRYGFTATVYVVVGELGNHNAWDAAGPRKPLLTADDVRRLAGDGVEVGSHSLTHRRLTTVDNRTLQDEIGASRIALEALTGGPVDGFCYPYGAVDTREVAMVSAAGYAYACAVGARAIAGPYGLPRTYIGDRDSSPRLHAKWIRHGLRHRRAGAR